MRRDSQHEPFELVGYECAEERGAFTNSLCAFLQIYNDTHQWILLNVRPKSREEVSLLFNKN
jgi:hypothetical protein